jgi:hypothetical protein
MKRLHVHVAVENLDTSIGFYARLFGAQPSVVKPDYAKWMLDDPRVNFAISTRAANAGLDHIGIQTDSRAELDEISARLRDAEDSVFRQESASCCYAKSDKAWARDPSGLSWETFFTHGEETVYGGDVARSVADLADPAAATSACCAAKPKANTAAGACC